MIALLVRVGVDQGHDRGAWIASVGCACQRATLRAAACAPNTPAFPRLDDHPDLRTRASDEQLLQDLHQPDDP